MGEIIRLADHARASAMRGSAGRACIAANVSNVIPFTSRLPARVTISDHISAGILPRAFQLLTTGGATESARATSDVPPRASMSASGVTILDRAIPATVFTYCECVKLHDTAIAPGPPA